MSIKKILLILTTVVGIVVTAFSLSQVRSWNCPTNKPIKGNAQSGIYHLPSGDFYNKTKPEKCFATEEEAKKAGYRDFKSEGAYRRPAFANKWKYFEGKTAQARAFGIVIAKAEIGKINNEFSGDPSIIEVYVLKGNAGGINYYLEDGEFKRPGEIQNWYSYGGDNMITGNPQVGDIVSWRGKDEEYAYGWTIYLEANDRKKSYELIRNIVSKKEYDDAIYELKDTAEWMRKEWEWLLKETPKYSLIEGNFPINKKLLTNDQVNSLLNNGNILQ